MKNNHSNIFTKTEGRQNLNKQVQIRKETDKQKIDKYMDSIIIQSQANTHSNDGQKVCIIAQLLFFNR